MRIESMSWRDSRIKTPLKLQSLACHFFHPIAHRHRLHFLLIFLMSVRYSLAFDPFHDSIDLGLAKPSASFQKILEDVDLDAQKMQSTKKLPIEYRIFRGYAAIRNLDEEDTQLLEPQKWLLVDGIAENDESTRSAAAYRSAAVLLLMRGKMDAAHEVLLGVTLSNMQDAEYAATHPGETTWAEDHPLSDSADMIHAALHRLEGDAVGEGNHTGFENSKFWLAGGPKMLESPALHSVRTQLKKYALVNAPFCVSQGVVAPCDGATHNIIAGGGKTRTASVSPGEWDGFVFVDICKRWVCGTLSHEHEKEVGNLQRAELLFLLRAELEACLRDQTA